MHAEPFRTKHAATGKLELIHMDLFGPLPDSLGKARHFVAVLDDATELAVASPLQRSRPGSTSWSSRPAHG